MPRDSSSVWVLPTMAAPASTSICTTGAVRGAGAWVRSQSGLPAPVTWPSMSNKSLAANVSPASGPPGAPFRKALACAQNAFSGSGIAQASFTRHGVDRRLVGRQAGDFTESDRLDWRPQAIIADLVASHAPRLGNHLGHRQPTEAALARAHAATQERLHLIGPGTAERHGVENLARGDFLAAAHHDIATRPAKIRGRLIQQIEKGAAALVSLQRVPRGTFLLGEQMLAGQRAHGRNARKPAARIGGLGSGDAGTVARDGDVRHVRRAVSIDAR